MKTPGRISFLSVSLVLALCLASATAFGFDQVFRVSDGKIIDFEQMVEDIKVADIIFVGEVHSSLKHHKAQLNIIKALNGSKLPTAIGLEMFRANSQKELDQWVEGTMPLGVFVGVYENNWGMPWPWYMNILKYARQAGIPLIGLNVSGEITEKVSRHGSESLTKEEMKQLPPNIAFDIDDQYLAHMRKVYEAHSKSDKTFENFYKAQMVWDKTMAYHLINFLKTNPGKTVVVLAGTDHSGKKGVPEQIKRQSKYSYKVILPEMPGRIERNTTTIEDSDYILLE